MDQKYNYGKRIESMYKCWGGVSVRGVWVCILCVSRDLSNSRLEAMRSICASYSMRRLARSCCARSSRSSYWLPHQTNRQTPPLFYVYRVVQQSDGTSPGVKYNSTIQISGDCQRTKIHCKSPLSCWHTILACIVSLVIANLVKAMQKCSLFYGNERESAVIEISFWWLSWDESHTLLS